LSRVGELGLASLYLSASSILLQRQRSSRISWRSSEEALDAHNDETMKLPKPYFYLKLLMLTTAMILLGN